MLIYLTLPIDSGDKMARNKVVTATMFMYVRRAPKSEFLGWGYRAIRKASTIATSPRLLKYRSCIAGKLAGKKFDNLKKVQEAFRKAAAECKEEAASYPTIPKGKAVPTLG